MGHLAIAYLLFVGYERWRASDSDDGIAVIILAIGALFPDLVDKPLAWYAGVLPTGRSLAHSLVVLVPLCLLVFAVTARYGRPRWGVAFGIGAISHALVDAMPVLWRSDASASFLVYPIVPIDGYDEAGPPGVIELFMGSLGDPYFLIEFPLLALAIVVWYWQGCPGLAIATRGRWGSERRKDV